MNNSIHFAGKLGLIAALASAIAGCTTHVHNPVRTVYVPAPAAEPYTPPSAPEPAPVVVVQPAPVVIHAPAPVVQIPAVIHTEADFHAPLSPYGEWIVVRGYGRCWRPRHVDVSWRPYADGRWEWTEAGWYWVSEEPWGWATYHYGRWDWTREYGWIWAPQTQWAPAWVTWREGAGYVGWAPLPPTAHISINGSLEIRGTIAAARFCFIETPRLLHPIRPATVIVNNTTIVNQTINVTKVKVVNHVVINEGPRTDNIERATGRRLHRNPVSEVRQRDEAEARGRRGRDHVTGEVHTPSRNNTTPRNEREAELGGIRHANPATPAVPAPHGAPSPAIAQPQAPEPVRTHPTRTDRQVEHGDIRPANPATPSATSQVVAAPPVVAAPSPDVVQPQAPEPVQTIPTRPVVLNNTPSPEPAVEPLPVKQTGPRIDRQPPGQLGGHAPVQPTAQAQQHGGAKPEKAELPVVANNTPSPQPAVEPLPVRQAPPRIDRQPPGQRGRPATVQPTAQQAQQHGGAKPEKAELPVVANNTPSPQPAVEPLPVRQAPPRIDRQRPGQPGGPAAVQPTAHIQPAPAPAAIPTTVPAEPKGPRNTHNPRVTHPVVASPQVNPSPVIASAPQTNRSPAEAEVKSPKEVSPKKDKEKANDKAQGKQRQVVGAE